jgi:tetratricopeptide (TPR) repeat protein/DNA-binding MarR family transcriptional regulator
MARLTVAERILLHLSQFPRHQEQFEVPRDLTQNGIADAIGVSRAHVTLELKELRKRGEVVEETKHVCSSKTKKKVYFVSPQGFQKINEIRSHVAGRSYRLKLPDGRTLELEGKKALERLKHDLGMGDGVLLALMFEGSLLDYGSLQKPRAASVESETAKVPSPRHFFGRKGELDTISSSLREKLPKVTVITGVAGIGKTTLAAKLAQTESAGGRKVFWYRCYECDSAQGMFRSLADWLRQAGRMKLSSYIRNTESIEPREAVFSLMSDLDFPHILVFDDCHKAPQLAPVFSLMLDSSPVSPLKVLMTSRDVPPFYSRADVSLNRSVAEMTLGGLDRACVGQLLSATGKTCSGTEVDTIYKRTMGHPLSVELIEDWKNAGAGSRQQYFYDEIESKLSPDERGLLDAMSVCRKPINAGALLELCGISAGLLDGLLRKSLVLRSNECCEIADSLREFFYYRIGDKVRRELHGKFASYYESLGAGHRAEAFRHLVLSGDAGRAAGFALEHGDELVESWHPDDLLEHLYMLETYTTKSGNAVGFLLMVGDLERRSGYLQKAQAHYEKAVSIIDCQPGETPRNDAVKVCMGLGEALSRQQKWGEAVRAVEKGLKFAGKDASGKASLRIALGGISMRRERPADARKSYILALATGKKLDNRALVARASGGLATVYGWMGDWKKSAQLGAVALKTATSAGTKNEQAILHNNLGLSLARLGRTGEAIAHFEKGVMLADETGNKAALMNGLLNAAEYYAQKGEYTRALDNCRKAGEICVVLGDMLELAGSQVTTGMVHRMSGDMDAARKSLDRADAIVSKLGDEDLRAQVYLEYTKLFIAMNELKRASTYLAGAERLYCKNSFPGMDEIHALKKSIGRGNFAALKKTGKGKPSKTGKAAGKT